ncbi:MAG: O-antigen ligase family protein [Betaproteobacteria bacterium]|nr:O-antigen ligase family protein [Betaproteobacteria bacterium]
MQKKITNICLFLAPALLFLFPGSYWLGTLMFLAIGISTLIQRKITFRETVLLIREVPAIWGFFVYAVFHVFLIAYHGDPTKDFGNIVPFLLAPFVLLAVTINQPNPRYFWLGCAAGALLAFSIGVTQVYVFHIERAMAFRDPISFGNISIVLGTGALVGLLYCRSIFNHTLTQIFLFSCGLAGLFSSLLSGSKGGWLSLLMIMLVLGNALTRSMHTVKRVVFIFGCFAILIAVVSFTPKLPVLDRLVSAYHGTVEWFKTGNVTEGSASIRLEAFKAGLMAGAQSPVVGLGGKGEQAAFREAVSAGQIRKELLEVNVVDNDFISLFSRHGLIGVFGALAVHLGLFYTFWRSRKEPREAFKALSTMGMLLVLFYIEFGLSVSIFGVSIFRTTYVSLAILLAGLLISEKRRLASAAPIA